MPCEILRGVFALKESNLRNSTTLQGSIKSVRLCSETISYFRPKIWDILAKGKICKWTPRNLLCRVCKMYIQNIGFLSVICMQVFVL